MKRSSGEPILITGGAGYIGSTTVHALVQLGYQPIVLDSLVQGRIEFIQGIPFYHGDISDHQMLDRIFDEYPSLSRMIHFAARIDVAESVLDPNLYYSENTIKTLALIQHSISRGINQVIFSSTAAIYQPKKGSQGLVESDAIELHSPYAASKWMAERILADIALCAGIKVLALRYFNPIGADPLMRCGPYKLDPTHILGRLTHALRSPSRQFTINGNDYPTRDGTALRDYVHVWDLAEAHVQALNYLQSYDAPPFDVMNLGSGVGITVNEFVTTFMEVSNQQLNVRIGQRRPGDNAGSHANSTRAKQILGWVPQFSLSRGISDALRWEEIWYKRHSEENKN